MSDLAPNHDDDVYDDDEFTLAELDAAREALEERQGAQPLATREPMFKRLMLEAIQKEHPDDVVLADFAQHVVGKLSDVFGLSSAKGGAFFREKSAAGYKVEHVRDDQSMRAHLVNGVLPAYNIAEHLYVWSAHPMRHWTDTTKRLFVAGYMLHDYTKIEEVQHALTQVGFRDGEPPSEKQVPHLEDAFRKWCDRLGLDAFLGPLGGSENVLHELIQVSLNTQIQKGRIPPHLLPRLHRDWYESCALAEKVSRLADLLAYSRDARNPRALVTSAAVNTALRVLSEDDDVGHVARLTYHHVAENRGVLLNFIHNACLDSLALPEARVPILYAPSGVVYLEHVNAPSMPDPVELTAHIIASVREKARQRLLTTGKLAKRGNVSVQFDESYHDYFSLREFILGSVKLIERYVKNNKSADRLAPVQAGGWPGAENIPLIPADARDARLDQLAEWIKLMETVFEARYPAFDLTEWVFWRFQMEDLRAEFDTLRNFPDAKAVDGGLKRWWFWAASHMLHRRPALDPTFEDRPDYVILWLETLAADLAAALPEEGPDTAQVNEDTWRDLSDYVGRVLTLGGSKASQPKQEPELAHYADAKGRRGGAACAICGSVYDTRKPTETAVSFQPGVYTARIKIAGGENVRRLCTICALEQLLRQLFVENLDSGSSAEGQRIRYLSFYPSYFFTPETLRFVRTLYQYLDDVRLSDREMLRALREGPLDDPKFWQRLDQFLMRGPDKEPSKRVLRYSEEAQTTFLTAGFNSADFRENKSKPTDTESWILPAFLSLVLPVCLDIKVVASESGVPLLLEADELPETVWFDGAHPAIRALVGDKPLNVDDIGPALTRLAAAYVVHLDTEYDQKRFLQHWSRFAPIAHALMESPLYVFHFLKQQERDGQQVGAHQVRRYVAYAEGIFNSQGERLMAHAQTLVDIYRRFYRAKRLRNSNSVLRPLAVVTEALLTLAQNPSLLKDDDEVFVSLRGTLAKFMDRVLRGQADGYVPKGSQPADREQAMDDFCREFIRIFRERFNSSAAALRSKEMNLLRDGCDYLYRRDQYRQYTTTGIPEEESDADDGYSTDEPEGSRSNA